MASSPGATCAISSTCSPTGPSPAFLSSPPPTSSKPCSKTKLSGGSTKIPSAALSCLSLADPHITQALYVAGASRVRTPLPERIRLVNGELEGVCSADSYSRLVNLRHGSHSDSIKH